MLEAIQSNPYRVLGIYSNSPTKERVANHNRLRAFLKVGKAAPMDLDLPSLLPPLVRTEKLVTAAEAQLTLPKDQLLHAQFWFMSATPLDKVAMNNLISGNIDRSVDIWIKQGNVSSLQNRIVCELAAENYVEALRCAEILYQSHLDEFVRIVLGEQQGGVTAEELAHHFLDELGNVENPKKIIASLTNVGWKEYVKRRASAPLLKGLEAALEKAKSTRGQDGTVRLEEGTKLMREAKKGLPKTKSLLGKTDLQYQIVADQLAEEIACCGIDYYNAHSTEAAREALQLLRYAQSIAEGQQMKQYCASNADGLQNVLDSLPPEGVAEDLLAITNELVAYRQRPMAIDYAEALLVGTQPHLRAIRAKLGTSNSLYLKVSTTVVDAALSGVIYEVNSAQEKVKRDTQIQRAIYELKLVLQSAWRVTKTMDTFDMDAEYRRKRYDENRSILERMCAQFGASTSGNSSSSQEWKGKWCLPVGTILGGIVGAIGGESVKTLLAGMIIGLIASVLIRFSIRNN